MTFELDTSGVVSVTKFDAENYVSYPETYCWDSLDPFAQGYTGAALSSIQWPEPAEGFGPSGPPRFDWLAPETVQRIVEDCAVFNGGGDRDTAENGESCWRIRQDMHPAARWVWERSKFSSYGPLTVYLADDGKVYFKEAN